MSTSTPISACLIVRDEASTIEACLASIRPYVDEIVVVDTGSVDETPSICRRYADKYEVFLDCNDPETGLIEDFALARNRSFAIATHDVVMWVDGDDIAEGAQNLPALADKLVGDAKALNGNGLLLLPYAYSHDAAERCTLLQYRERLLYPRRHWEWRFPVHECCLLAAGNGVGSEDKSDTVKLVHQSHKSSKPRESGRNRRILEKYLDKVGEADVRSLYYYGVELSMAAGNAFAANDPAGFLRHTGRSLHVLKRYVELAYADEEKCLALLEICRHYQNLNDHVEAIQWAFRAMATKSWPEPYWRLCKSFCALAEQDKRQAVYNCNRAIHFGKLGMAVKPNDDAHNLLAQDLTRRYEIQETLSFCMSRVGDLDGAIASAEFGLSGLPENETLQRNLKAFRLTRARRRVLSDVAELAAGGGLNPGADTIIKGAINGDFTVQLLSTPTDMPDDASGRILPAGGAAPGSSGADTCDTERPSRANGKLDILFFVGQGLEPWNPDTFARTGLGGSETMAWEMARRLAALGHSVRLVGHCGQTAPAGVFEGVEFINWQTFLGPSYGGSKECDVLVTSRRPEITDAQWGVKATARVLWVHDVTVGESLTHKRNLRIDRILALSNWHKSILRRSYPLIDASKIIVTRNGIDLERFAGKEKRNPRRAIYSSSPDRGLETLLDVWPIVRKSIPDAELHCFYGFDNWQKTAEMNGDQNQIKVVRFLMGKIERTAGVVMHGRVNQTELAREFMASGVWAYPTGFTETSCITAMEAQAAGCRIVTSPLAALNETVGQRGQLVPGFGTPAFIEEFAAAVVVAMAETIGNRAADDREALARYARENFGLDELAKEWDSMLNELVADVRERVVPAFHEAVSA